MRFISDDSRTQSCDRTSSISSCRRRVKLEAMPADYIFVPETTLKVLPRSDYQVSPSLWASGTVIKEKDAPVSHIAHKRYPSRITSWYSDWVWRVK